LGFAGEWDRTLDVSALTESLKVCQEGSMVRIAKLGIAFLVMSLAAAVASGQNYKVETYKLLEVFGNVKAFSCGGGCCEGHDSTACVGVQLLRENESHAYDLARTVIYDNVSCCDAQCADRQGCGIWGKDGPANSCPNNTSRFTVAIGGGSSPTGNLDLCVSPGQVFRVPFRVALLGNVVNNSWSGGSKCSAADPFEPYANDPFGTDTWGGSAARWGGFTDSCPNPVNPDIVCVPSDCTPGFSDDSHAVPRYGAEIIDPYGNEYVTRWDIPGVTLRWRATGPYRLDTYRIVVHGPAGVFIDRRVACETVECHHAEEFPLEAASYYWWVQPVSSTVTGGQSRAGVFNLNPPLPSCNGIGGSCAFPTKPDEPAACAETSIPIYGALDCPNTCCAVDCAIETSHVHTGSCGATDVCGHVFGTPADPGCEGAPPDTLSCGELGGDYCSATFSCPPAFVSLGTTRQNGSVECLTCCKQTIGDGYCEPGVENCGTSPADCPCSMPGTACNASGAPGQCVDRCSDPAFHAHSGSCGQLDECGHAIGNPRDCLPTCGAMGGSYCSQSGSCPSGYDSLGASSDCSPCCKPKPQPSCGQMGGSYCSQSGSCPSGYNSLGASSDCSPCCKPKPQPSCGAMGGDYCSQTASCPANYTSLGASSDCTRCCKYSPPPSCGAMGGDYCSQSASCPANYTSLGASSDCKKCCKYEPPPSCGAMGGDYCSQSASCPSGYSSLGASSDCARCCVSEEMSSLEAEDWPASSELRLEWGDVQP
jgi:hypothetical protein